MAAPMPLEAPVTIATLPCSFFDMIGLLELSFLLSDCCFAIREMALGGPRRRCVTEGTTGHSAVPYTALLVVAFFLAILQETDRFLLLVAVKGVDRLACINQWAIKTSRARGNR